MAQQPCQEDAKAHGGEVEQSFTNEGAHIEQDIRRGEEWSNLRQACSVRQAPAKRNSPSNRSFTIKTSSEQQGVW